jgi:hypothetical protein
MQRLAEPVRDGTGFTSTEAPPQAASAQRDALDAEHGGQDRRGRRAETPWCSLIASVPSPTKRRPGARRGHGCWPNAQGRFRVSRFPKYPCCVGKRFWETLDPVPYMQSTSNSVQAVASNIVQRLIIVDCLLKEDGIANDSTLLIPAVKRIRDVHGDKSASTIVGDRGFFSKKNTQELEDMDVTDATLPRSPKAMEELLKDPGNRELHKCRAQTEARIGILKSKFLGDHLPTKGFSNQRRYVAWAVLAHNLWVLAKMEQSVEYLAKAG